MTKSGTGPYIRSLAGFEQAISDGRAFVADTTQLTASDNFNILFENTSTNKAVTIVKVVSYSGADNPVFSSILQNPTNNTPSTERSTENLLQSATGDSEESPAMRLLAEDMGNAMTAGNGTDTNVDLTFVTGFSTRDFAYSLAPGESVGIAIPGGTIFGTGTDVKMSLFCYQQTV